MLSSVKSSYEILLASLDEKMVGVKKVFSRFIFVAALIAASSLYAQQAPSIEWQKCLGGSGGDWAQSIQQTADGGYIVAGWTTSNDSDVSGNHGAEDYWIVKLDSAGNLEWQKCLGGTGDDVAWSIKQTTNGGFIVAGVTASNDIDVSGNHGLSDYWIVKLDAIGNLVWQTCLGGSSYETATSIQQTSDGEFIVGGSSSSNDWNVTGHHGYNVNSDFWVVKLDSAPYILWEKSLGGSGDDWIYSIQQSLDGGYIVAGYSRSPNDGDVTGYHGGTDEWIVKLDADGNIVWQKCLGGTAGDGVTSIKQTSDGGFIAAGGSWSDDGDVTGHHEDSIYSTGDYWITKLDTAGNMIWEKSLGGIKEDVARSVQQTNDGGFIVAGYAESIDGDVTGNHGGSDYWLVKLDSSGNLSWEKTFGGSWSDQAYSIHQTTDGGFIIAGGSYSNDDDVSGWHPGYDLYGNPTSDYWIVKLSPEIPTAISSSPTNIISLHPNPVQNLLTITLATQAANATIRVYDLQGKKMNCEFRIANVELNSIQLNTSSLPDGFYTLQIINNKTGESEVGKFVKQ